MRRFLAVVLLVLALGTEAWGHTTRCAPRSRPVYHHTTHYTPRHYTPTVYYYRPRLYVWSYWYGCWMPVSPFPVRVVRVGW